MSIGTGSIRPEAFLVHAMWSWSSQVFGPVQSLRRAGLLPKSTPIGDLPEVLGRSDLGAKYSILHKEPVVLSRATEHDHLVEEFDRMAEVYDAFVKPFSGPIFDGGLEWIRPYLKPDTRALDAGCGAGRELQRMARLFPEGEVVGDRSFPGDDPCGASKCSRAWADQLRLLSVGRGRPAQALHRRIRSGLQLPGPPPLPRSPAGYARDSSGATSRRHLRRGRSRARVVQPPRFAMALYGDPGWIGFHTPEEFRTLFLNAGFARAGWVEVLPGFGVAFGQAAA